jgi:hypothetical protein
MRVLAAWIVALGLAVSPALAGTGGAGDGKDTTAAKTSDNTPPAGAAESLSAAKPAAPASPSLENQLQQLRDLLEAQSRQLQMQNEQLKEQQRKMQAMEEQMKNVSTSSSNSDTLVNEADMGGLGSNPAIGGVKVTSLPNQDKKSDDEPLSIRFKGITLTPGGFLAAETVWRQRGITNDVNTDFKGIPMPGQSANSLSELNFSGRQSRISLKGEGKLASVKLTGYFEGDWLSAGVTSNNNESNSYTFRQRQLWGQAAFDSGWKITGGQQWSLVTETKHGLDNLTEATPLTIDAQYTAGFSWERQYGLRITKNLGEKFWLGLSIEGPQTTLGGKIQNDTTLIAAPGDLGGLFNNQANYSYNQSPDIVLKGAWEPGFGHYEVFGIISTFKARLFPCAAANALNPCPINASVVPSAIGAFNDSRTAGGIGGNARWSMFTKKFDLGIHFLGGNGVARYGTTTLVDVTTRPDGSLVPLRSYIGLISAELTPTPKLTLYAYAGGEYDGRAAYTTTRVTAAGPPPVITTLGVGYGSPLNSNAGCFTEVIPTNQNMPGALGACQQDNRNIIEGTLGYWYRFYQGTKGRMQLGMQYSYAARNTWSANAGGDPHGVENMFFTSFRYYLP